MTALTGEQTGVTNTLALTERIGYSARRTRSRRTVVATPTQVRIDSNQGWRHQTRNSRTWRFTCTRGSVDDSTGWARQRLSTRSITRACRRVEGQTIETSQALTHRYRNACTGERVLNQWDITYEVASELASTVDRVLDLRWVAQDRRAVVGNARTCNGLEMPTNRAEDVLLAELANTRRLVEERPALARAITERRVEYTEDVRTARGLNGSVASAGA